MSEQGQLLVDESEPPPITTTIRVEFKVGVDARTKNLVVTKGSGMADVDRAFVEILRGLSLGNGRRSVASSARRIEAASSPVPAPLPLPASWWVLNKKQKVCLWVGIVLASLLLLFPPPGNTYATSEWPVIVFSQGMEHYKERVTVPLWVIGLITAGGIFSFAKPKE